MAKIETARQIGAIIRSERKQQGLTQQQLADAASVSRALISRLEKGAAAALYPEKLLAVLGALGLSLFINESQAADGSRSSKPTLDESLPIASSPSPLSVGLAQVAEKATALQKMAEPSVAEATKQLASAMANYNLFKTSPLFFPSKQHTEGGDQE